MSTIIKANSLMTEIRDRKEKLKTKTDLPDNDRLIESQDFSLRHKTVLERVRSILRGDKYARKDYLWLLLRYYSACNMIKIIVPLEDFQIKNSPESISRAKRELVEEAKKGNKELAWLLTDQEFLEDMKKEEQNYHNYYSDKLEEDKKC